MLNDLSNVYAALENCRAELPPPTHVAVVRHVKSAIFDDDVAELTLLQRFLRIGCWASMPVFFLKILLLSLGSISLIALSAFPAEVFSALVVTPYLINIINPGTRYRMMRFFAQKYHILRQRLQRKWQQQLEKQKIEEVEDQDFRNLSLAAKYQ
jgi:hypothetical protein